jgi:hypothetical protein
VPSQQPKGQLQTQHSLDTGNYTISLTHGAEIQTKITGKYWWKKIIIIIIIINVINSVTFF